MVTLFLRMYFTTEKLSDVQWNIWGLGEIRTKMSRHMTKPTILHVRPAKTDQPEHPVSLIRIYAVRINKCLVLHTAKTLIRLGG